MFKLLTAEVEAVTVNVGTAARSAGPAVLVIVKELSLPEAMPVAVAGQETEGDE